MTTSHEEAPLLVCLYVQITNIHVFISENIVVFVYQETLQLRIFFFNRYSEILCENAGQWQDPPICDPEDVKKPVVKKNRCDTAEKDAKKKDLGCPERSSY